MRTVVGTGPSVRAASVAANVVLNALSTRDCGSAVARAAAAELSAGTTSESNVSKSSGLVMSTTTLPARWSPWSASTCARAGYGTARTTTSPLGAVPASPRPSVSTVWPPDVTTSAMAWPMVPVPMMLTCVMAISRVVDGAEGCSDNNYRRTV
jgi:hypothetical protein